VKRGTNFFKPFSKSIVSSTVLILLISAIFSAVLVPVNATIVNKKLVDMIAEASEAEWWSGDGGSVEQLTFGGPDTDNRGFAMYKYNIKLNDGKTYSKILETHPRWVDNGFIYGVYGPFHAPPNGATFKAKVGFIQGGTAGKARIMMYVYDPSTHEMHTILDKVIEYADGVKTFSANFPESILNRDWYAFLYVNAYGSSGQDWVSWVYAYIYGKFVVNINVDTTEIELTQGESVAVTVHVTGDYPDSVSLSVTGLPSGVSASFSPTSHKPPHDFTMTLSATDDASTGSFPINIKVKKGGTTLTTKTVSLKINPKAHPDFTIDISPKSASVNRGDAITYSIIINPLEGFDQPVSLSISGLPAGATYEFTPSSGTPPFTSTLRIETSDSTPLGSHTITVTASGGGKSHSVSADLVVKEAPSFSITLSEEKISVIQGESADITVDIESSGGFSEVVSLSVRGLTEGLTANFNPESDNAPYTSTLTITASSDVPPGTYDLMVMAVGGGLTREAPITVEVKEMPSFEITITPSSASVTQGEETRFTVEVKASGGFSETVNLSVINVPAGASASLSISSGTPPFTSTLTIRAGEDVSTGVYDLSLRAEGGGIVKTERFRLKIKEAVKPFDFELTATPSSITVKPGQSTSIAILVTLKSGKAEPVSLTVAGLPSDFSYSFNPPSVTPTSSSTLQLTAGNTPGSYTLVVQAIGGGVAKTANVYVKVEEEKRCLIATAAFGSELSPQVQILRGFRDGFVMKTFAGSQFMNVFNSFYYSWSPYVAKAEENNQFLRGVIKSMIYPLIYSLEFSRRVAQPLSSNPEMAVLVSGILTSVLIGLIYISPIIAVISALKLRKADKWTHLAISYTLRIMAAAIIIFSLAEILLNPPLMMFSSALIVLASISLGALIMPIIVKAIGRLKSPA